MSEFSDMIGNDNEDAYKKAFGADAFLCGGTHDHGVDIVLQFDDDGKMNVQLKSSQFHAERFWADSILRKKSDSRFIRLCVGAPGEKEEVAEALKTEGFWVGYDINNRDAGIARLRTLRDVLLGDRAVA